jgi:hypothetical protein
MKMYGMEVDSSLEGFIDSSGSAEDLREMDSGLYAILSRIDRKQTPYRRRVVTAELFDYLSRRMPEYYGLPPMRFALKFETPEAMQRKGHAFAPSGYNDVDDPRLIVLNKEVLEDRFYLAFPIFPLSVAHEIGHSVDRRINRYRLKGRLVWINGMILRDQDQIAWKFLMEGIADALSTGYLHAAPCNFLKGLPTHVFAGYVAYGVNDLSERDRKKRVKEILQIKDPRLKLERLERLAEAGFRGFPRGYLLVRPPAF